MTTRVVNLHHAPGAAEVYIGRPTMGRKMAEMGLDRTMLQGPLPFGAFGNPVSLYRPCPGCGQKHKKSQRDQVMGCYTRILLSRILSDARFADALPALRGRALGCWCHPEPCHGHVLAAVVDLDLAHDVQERTAIGEFHGGLPREVAESQAVTEIASRLPGLMPW